MTKDLISIQDLTPKDFDEIFELTSDLKQKQKRGEPHHLLSGKTLGMIFAKPSTRTRVSFEVGIFQLGGVGLYLSASDLQLGRGETITDTARVLSRYLDGIMIRTFDQNEVKDLARHATIPVINGLTDLEHPCQILADLFTIKEYKGKLAGLTLAYVGDGNNNVTHSLLLATSKIGMNMICASPSDYQPDSAIFEKALQNARETKVEIKTITDPKKAVKNADVVVTDTWVSMGRSDVEKRIKAFTPYQLNQKLLNLAKPEAIVLHCLPAHRGHEITDEVIDGKQSVVLDEAENRLHVQKAIMVKLMGS